MFRMYLIMFVGAVVTDVTIVQFIQQYGKGSDLAKLEDASYFTVATARGIIVTLIMMGDVSVIDLKDAIPLMVAQFKGDSDSVGFHPSKVFERTFQVLVVQWVVTNRTGIDIEFADDADTTALTMVAAKVSDSVDVYGETPTGAE